MADDITLTVRVRDLSRGDFDRLEGRLNRMRQDLRGVTRDGDSAGMHSRRLGQDIEGLSEKFKKMQETGRLSRRELTQMRGTLDGMSRSALNAARSGEITTERYRSLHGEISRMRGELDRFDAGLNRTNNNHRTTIRMVNGMVQSVRTMTRTLDGNTNVINTWRRDADRTARTLTQVGGNGNMVNSTFGNMRAKLIGTAVVLGASLLPTIGALAPMLAGVGAIAGVAALAFMGLSKPTKQLTTDQKNFLKGLKPLKDEFHKMQAAAQKAVLPGLTKSFGDIGRAMKALNPVIKIGGEAFSKLVDKIAKGISSKDFMGPFLKNVKMGVKWVDQFAGSIGTFTKAFFDFGTKSQKALDAWQNLLGGFLDRGLPGMFKNMESGISGASDWLNGLAYIINDSLLPTLGKMLAALMKAFGPLLLQTMKIAGNVFNNLGTVFSGLMVALSPITNTLADIFKGFVQIGTIGTSVFGSLFKALSGALGGTLSDLGMKNNPFTALEGGFTQFSKWVQNNQAGIRQAFMGIAEGIITMVQIGVGILPTLSGAFVAFVKVAMGVLGTLVTGFTAAFSHLPGPIGDLARNMKSSWDGMEKDWSNKLDAMQSGVQRFSDAAQPNLNRAKLVLNKDQAQANLDSIKKQLADPSLTKDHKARLSADKSDAEARLAEATRDLNRFDRTRAVAKIEANNAPFFGAFNQANHAHLAKKSTTITANAASFWNIVGGITGRVLGTSYINVQMRKVESQNAPAFHAMGGVIHRADGGGSGPVNGPGTSTSDSIPAMLSNGEYVVRASSVRKYGPRFMSALNRGTLKVAGFKKGGMSQSTKDARNALTGSFGISYFGRQAGYKRTPFEHSIAVPTDINDLVSNLNGILSNIRKAFSGKTEKHLVAQLASSGKALIKNQKNLDKVNKALDAAKTKLDDLKQAAANLKDAVTQGVMSATDITKVSQGDSNVTMSDIMRQMQISVAKSSAFADALKQLKDRGVSKDIINQIANAGIEGGGLETAGAILSGSDSDIANINAMQKKINDSAASAGKTASDAMFAAGIKAADGLVKGLEKKQKSIEDAMLRIAKSMEKAIKKALGIHSPSRVMQRVGHYTAEGFAVGMKKNTAVNTAWSSMLTTKATTNSGGSVAGGGGGQYVIPIYIGNKMVDEIWLDTARRVVRTRGGNVQSIIGRK